MTVYFKEPPDLLHILKTDTDTQMTIDTMDKDDSKMGQTVNWLGRREDIFPARHPKLTAGTLMRRGKRGFTDRFKFWKEKVHNVTAVTMKTKDKVRTWTKKVKEKAHAFSFWQKALSFLKSVLRWINTHILHVFKHSESSRVKRSALETMHRMTRTTGQMWIVRKVVTFWQKLKYYFMAGVTWLHHNVIMVKAGIVGTITGGRVKREADPSLDWLVEHGDTDDDDPFNTYMQKRTVKTEMLTREDMENERDEERRRDDKNDEEENEDNQTTAVNSTNDIVHDLATMEDNVRKKRI